MLRFALCAVLVAAPLAYAGDENSLEHHVRKLVDALRVSHLDFDMSTEEGQDKFKKSYMMAEKARQELVAVLQKKPEAWAWARPSLQKLPRDPERTEVRVRLVEILALDSDASSRALLVKELKESPKTFSIKAMIRMDESGVPEATEALHQLVKDKPGLKNLYPAIHLGMKGQAVAKPVLEWARNDAKVNRYLGSWSYGTAVALKRLGAGEAWSEIVRRATNQVEASLDDDDLKTARWYAVQLEFYAKLVKGGKASVLTLDMDCASYSKKRSAEITDADQVRELLKRVTA